MNETRTYSDGTTATGPAPLPTQSPAQQDSETGPCDKCQGSGKLFDRRIGDVVCDECHGHGWFNDGVAGPATDAPHEWVCAIHRGGKCTCSVLDAPSSADGTGVKGPDAPADELDTILQFLYGAGPLDGCWYGDGFQPNGQGKFWWRSKLRAALAARGVQGGQTQESSNGN